MKIIQCAFTRIRSFLREKSNIFKLRFKIQLNNKLMLTHCLKKSHYSYWNKIPAQ